MTLSHLGDRMAQYGYIRLWGSIGFIVVVLGLGYWFDYRPVSDLLWAVLGFMSCIVLFARFMPEAVVARHEHDHAPIMNIVRRTEVWILLAACFLMAAAHGPYYTFYSIYLVEHGYAKSAVGWLWAIGVVAEIGVFLWLPRIKQVNFERLLQVTFAVAAMRFLMIAWGVGSPAVVVAAQVLHAFHFRRLPCGIREAVRERAMRASEQSVRIITGMLGRRSLLIGAIVQAINVAIHNAVEKKNDPAREVSRAIHLAEVTQHT